MGENLQQFGRWLGFRAQEKVQGVVVSNGMWLLWTMMQRNDGVDRVAITVGDEADDGQGMANDGAAVKNTVMAVEDILTRRQRLIQWLSERCIYCEVKNAPPSRRKHWHSTCLRSQSIPDECSYDKALDFQEEMDKFRKDNCYSCSLDVEEECGVRDSWEVTCEYGDIILHTVFMLHKTGWLKAWLRREGYQVAVGYAQLQVWLNQTSDKGGLDRNRAVEAFEAYASEFTRWV